MNNTVYLSWHFQMGSVSHENVRKEVLRNNF